MRSRGRPIHDVACLVVVGLGACAADGVQARAKPAIVGCQAFINDFAQSLGDLKVQFNRALIVHGGSQSASKAVNVYDIASPFEVDGTVECQGNDFVRLELRIAVPTTARVLGHLERFEVAALRAALRWDAARSASLLARMTKDVAEYLRASAERGDVYISGHDEQRLNDGTTVGLLWTQTDRNFVISSLAEE